jgi:hypothetical protein
MRTQNNIKIDVIVLVSEDINSGPFLGWLQNKKVRFY